jgi:hypothetical protein
MRNKLKGDLRGEGEKQETEGGAMLNREILRIEPRKTIPQAHSRPRFASIHELIERIFNDSLRS